MFKKERTIRVTERSIMSLMTIMDNLNLKVKRITKAPMDEWCTVTYKANTKKAVELLVKLDKYNINKEED